MKRFIVVLDVPVTEDEGNPGLWDWTTLCDTVAEVRLISSVEKGE